MYKSALIIGLILNIFPLHASAKSIILKNHDWQVTDISKTPLTDDQVINSLRTNWDSESDDEDLAHLYSFQISKKFKINTAKIFLFTEFKKSYSTTLINEHGDFLALNTSTKSFVQLPDWILQRSGQNCTELTNPTSEIIFLMQMNIFNPGSSCYYMIVPAHVWQQTELYPTSTPKDFIQDDIIEACYNSSDRKIFKKDRKACKRWVQQLQ